MHQRPWLARWQPCFAITAALMALVAVVLGSINMATLFDTHDEVQAVLKKLGDGTGSLAKEIATDEVNMLQGPAALNIHGSNGDGPPAFPPLDAEPEMYPQGNPSRAS